MLTISVDSISPSRSGLRLGGVLRYGEHGPVRFVEVVVPWPLFSKQVREDVSAQLARVAFEEWDRGNPREEEATLDLTWTD